MLDLGDPFDDGNNGTIERRTTAADYIGLLRNYYCCCWLPVCWLLGISSPLLTLLAIIYDRNKERGKKMKRRREEVVEQRVRKNE